MALLGKVLAMKMAVMVLGLLALIQPLMGLSNLDQLRIPRNTRSFGESATYGLITTSSTIEKTLTQSGYFTKVYYFDISGRRFTVGYIGETVIVYVRTSSNPQAHAGITTQILLDNFKVAGIIAIGTVGATNESLALGTVSVPRMIAFTGSWEWLSKDSNETGQLDIGLFNYPENGENLLGSINIDKIDIYWKEQCCIKNYYVNTHRPWRKLARKIKLESAKVKVGLVASSSDIYVKNPAYREFLYKTFNASTVDGSSASIGLAALPTNVNFIVLQGISNYAGAGNSSTSASALASKNVVEALYQFVLILQKSPAIEGAEDL